MRAAALVVLLFLAFPQAAAAHAVLVSATPERGTQVDAAPEQVTLRFNEPVEAGFGAVRVFDGEGERVDEGDPLRPGGDSEAIGGRPPQRPPRRQLHRHLPRRLG